MNIFKAIGIIMASLVSVITGTCQAITEQGVPAISSGLATINNALTMTEEMSASMLQEQRAEATQSLKLLTASFEDVTPTTKATKKPS